jgi:hypothetical protein
VFTTPVYAFAMQSREGVFEEVVAEVSEDADDACALLKVLDGMQGNRAAGVKEMRAVLSAVLRQRRDTYLGSVVAGPAG